MGKRKAIPKGIRFEVFKRDSFRCQYCGRAAPDVILEIDHVVPIAEGGDNDALNLITSCRDCNRGKGKKMLADGSAIDRQRQQLDDLNAIREQTEMLIQWKRELMQMDETKIDAIEDYIESVSGRVLTEHGRQEMRKLLKRFPFQDVYEAAGIAYTRYDISVAFNKIGGICFNWAKKRMEEDAKQTY